MITSEQMNKFRKTHDILWYFPFVVWFHKVMTHSFQTSASYFFLILRSLFLYGECYTKCMLPFTASMAGVKQLWSEVKILWHYLSRKMFKIPAIKIKLVIKKLCGFCCLAPSHCWAGGYRKIETEVETEMRSFRYIISKFIQRDICY